MKRAAAALALCASLAAHPLGNASVSHYARLAPDAEGVALTYVLDLAEIPSFELFQDWGLEPRAASRAEIEARARRQARAWVEALRLTSSGRPVQARFEDAGVTIADGAGGLLVLRIAARARIEASGNLQYEDANYAERAGWKEVVIAAGPGAVLVKASHGPKDLSQMLTQYPEDPTLAPPQELRAELTWTAAPPPAPSAEPAVRAPPPVLEPTPQPAADGGAADAPASRGLSAPALAAIAFGALLLAAGAIFCYRRAGR
jgi:nickel/cobalt exporter